MLQKIREAQVRLRAYMEAQNYTGYDIYDGLSLIPSPRLRRNQVVNPLVTQWFKKSPINARPLLGFPKTAMPKTLGLVLEAYARIAQATESSEEKTSVLQMAMNLRDRLLQSALTSFAGPCWNFGFHYKFMFDQPTVVITAIVARGLHHYYLATGDEQVKSVLINIQDFILQDLHQTRSEQGLCFSYTPIQADCCYNANLLAAETLARIYALTGDERLLFYINAAVEFVLAHQKADGRWNYSLAPDSGIERRQVDFHQGFILDSLFACGEFVDGMKEKLEPALLRGTEFYFSRQFLSDGRSLWRYPKIWPVDIHHQAQGIITLTKLRNRHSAYFPFAHTIATWTIENMRDPAGFFYYQKHRLYTNQIPYMRWAQAWMLLALTILLCGDAQ